MQVLQMIKDIFGEMPTIPDLHSYFQHKRQQLKDDRRFFMEAIQCLGGRSYNNFLDYYLFAMKIISIYNKHLYRRHSAAYRTLHDDEHGDGVLFRLIFDDRHDLWQNLPYMLERAIDKANADKEPISVDAVNAFWGDMTTALIECINLDGTGDASVNVKYPLKREK